MLRPTIDRLRLANGCNKWICLRPRKTIFLEAEVKACKCRGLDQANKDATLNLLAIEFAEHDPPAGTVTLTFSGGGAIRLEVECLEAELADLGEAYAAVICPDHFAGTSAA